MQQFYVYIYFDPTRDHEPFYVGKGKRNRSDCHLTRTDHHPVTYRIRKLKKLGLSPIIEREYCESEDAAYALEAELVAQIGRKNINTGPLLNLTDGGKGGRGMVMTEEQRKRISTGTKAALTPEVRSRISIGTSKAQKGKPNGPMSEAQKKSISQTLKESYTDEMREKLKQKVVCPHCGKEGAITVMQRWHFKNCKVLINKCT